MGPGSWLSGMTGADVGGGGGGSDPFHLGGPLLWIGGDLAGGLERGGRFFDDWLLSALGVRILRWGGGCLGCVVEARARGGLLVGGVWHRVAG